MKLKYEMESVEIGGEKMAVPVGCENTFRGILRINETTADILKILKDDVSEDEIVSALKKEYTATDEQIRHNIQKVLDTLREYQLIIE